VQRLALRTGQGPLRPAWSAAHAVLLRSVAGALRRHVGEATVYVRGGFGRGGEPVFGLSDIDLLVVLRGDPAAPGAARARLMQDWRRATRKLPALRGLVVLGGFEDAELADATKADVLTHDLGARNGSRGRALFFGEDPLADHVSFRSRPGLYEPTADWRRVAGPERRPAPRNTGERRLAAAWLELQCWWRYAAHACAQPRDPHAAHLSVKMIAEPVRILLWLRHGERVFSRRRALERGLARMPENETAIRLGLDLYKALPRRPDPALAQVLPAMLALSAQVAAEIEGEVREAGTTDVALAGGTWATLGGGERLPLADWGVLTMGSPPDEVLVLLGDADASDPASLATAAAAEAPGVAPALPWGPLLVMPSLDRATRPLPRGMLRSIQCEASDPVSHGLASGASTARFPRVPGWSAHDVARRAVAEQRAHLAEASRGDSAGHLAALLGATRAALFLESIELGEPRLPLTLMDACAELGARTPRAAGLAAEAADAWRARRPPSAGLLKQLEGVVGGLPPYAA